MIYLIKCHFQYLINKTTLLIFIVVLLISILVNITIGYEAVKTFDISSYEYYFQNVFMIEKIFTVFINVFIYGYSFLNKQDQYRYLIISNKISRRKYFISKIVLLTLISFITTYLEFFLFVLIGGFCGFYFSNSIIYSYLSLFIITIFYGNLVVLLMLIFNAFYVIIIPLFIYLYMFVQSDTGNEKVLKIINYLFIMEKGNELYYGWYYSLILIFLVFQLTIIIYNNKSLK